MTQKEAKKQEEMGEIMTDSKKINLKILKNNSTIDHDLFAKKLNKSSYKIRIFEYVGIRRRTDFEKKQKMFLTIPILLDEFYGAVRSSLYSILDDFCDAGLLLKKKLEGEYENKYFVIHHDDWAKIAKLRRELLQKKYEEKIGFVKFEEKKEMVIEEKTEIEEEEKSGTLSEEGDENDGKQPEL